MPWGMHTKDTPGKGRILIVDDEGSIRKALRLTLTKAGYDVVEADDGGKGIEAIGAGYKWQATSVDIAYLLGFYEKRAINSSTIVPDNLAGTTTFGSYSTTAQVLVLSVTHRF